MQNATLRRASDIRYIINALDSFIQKLNKNPKQVIRLIPEMFIYNRSKPIERGQNDSDVKPYYPAIRINEFTDIVCSQTLEFGSNASNVSDEYDNSIRIVQSETDNEPGFTIPMLVFNPYFSDLADFDTKSITLSADRQRAVNRTYKLKKVYENLAKLYAAEYGLSNELLAILTGSKLIVDVPIEECLHIEGLTVIYDLLQEVPYKHFGNYQLVKQMFVILFNELLQEGAIKIKYDGQRYREQIQANSTQSEYDVWLDSVVDAFLQEVVSRIDVKAKPSMWNRKPVLEAVERLVYANFVEFESSANPLDLVILPTDSFVFNREPIGYTYQAVRADQLINLISPNLLSYAANSFEVIEPADKSEFIVTDDSFALDHLVAIKIEYPFQAEYLEFVKWLKQKLNDDSKIEVRAETFPLPLVYAPLVGVNPNRLVANVWFVGW